MLPTMKVFLILFLVVAFCGGDYAPPSAFRHAQVLSVHDGDTLRATVDLGQGVALTDSCRLIGINARELSQPGGAEDRDYLTALIAKHCPDGQVVIELLGRDKYGRLLVRLWGVTASGKPVDLNEQMVKSGHAKVYEL